MLPARPLTPEAETGPERRCLASGRVAPKSSLVRLVVGPDGKVVPDLDAKLPGRGHYLSPEREVVERAEAKGLIRRATGAEVEPGLADRLEALLARRLIERIGLAGVREGARAPEGRRHRWGRSAGGERRRRRRAGEARPAGAGRARGRLPRGERARPGLRPRARGARLRRQGCVRRTHRRGRGAAGGIQDGSRTLRA
jgi:predicted RNA-binding protein YlxR (DUF448 family)